VYESIAGPDRKFTVPTMEELAMQEATSWIHGGETLALERLETWFTERKVEAALFEKPKTSPASFDPIESE
jgi:cryptochrome